jgi:hypothetical protein
MPQTRSTLHAIQLPVTLVRLPRTRLTMRNQSQRMRYVDARLMGVLIVLVPFLVGIILGYILGKVT